MTTTIRVTPSDKIDKPRYLLNAIIKGAFGINTLVSGVLTVLPDDILEMIPGVSDRRLLGINAIASYIVYTVWSANENKERDEYIIESTKMSLTDELDFLEKRMQQIIKETQE